MATHGHLEVTAFANPKKSGVKVADAQGNRWRIYLVNDDARRVYVAKGARKTSFGWGPEKRAKLFVTKGEAMRYRADYVAHYFPKYEVGVEPVPYGPTWAEVHGVQNPTFGKRRTGKPKAAKRVAKKAAPKFGRKKVSGAKNPTRSNTAPKQYLVRATTKGDKVYYFTGFSLTSFKRDAAKYPNADAAQKTMEHVEDAMSNGLKRANVKFLDVIQA